MQSKKKKGNNKVQSEMLYDLYEMPRQGKSIQTKSRLLIIQSGRKDVYGD